MILEISSFCNKSSGFLSACLFPSSLVSFRPSRSTPPFVFFQWMAMFKQECRGNLGSCFFPAGAPVPHRCDPVRRWGDEVTVSPGSPSSCQRDSGLTILIPVTSREWSLWPRILNYIWYDKRPCHCIWRGQAYFPMGPLPTGTWLWCKDVQFG